MIISGQLKRDDGEVFGELLKKKNIFFSHCHILYFTHCKCNISESIRVSV